MGNRYSENELEEENLMNKNGEGYVDPTAELAGFEVVGRIVLKDKRTGKEYR